MVHKMDFDFNRLLAGICVLGSLSMGVSCSKRDSATHAQPATNGPQVAAASASVQTNKLGKTLLEMSPDDVVVTVNGVSLTKKQSLERFELTMQRLAQMPNMDKGKLAAIAKYMSRNYISGFVNAQLLLQEARKTGVLTGKALADATDEWIARTAKQANKTVPKYLELVPGGAESLRKEAEENVLVEAMIATNVLPKATVSDRFVKATIETIQAENAAVDATNALKVARLNTLREQIVAGADFGKLADVHSECKRSAPGNNGYWGEFDRNDISDRKMQEAIFKLKPGEISEVLSDDEGFHLVKVLAYKGGAKKTDGKVSVSESASLAHILLRREPALEMTVPADLKKQLAEQKKQLITSEYIKSLRAKAVIDYPNGTNFWPTASQKKALTQVKTPAHKK